MMVALTLFLGAAVPTTRPADLAGVIPGEAAAAIILDSLAASSGPGASAGGGWDVVAMLLRQARQLGLAGEMSADSRVVADVIGSLPLLSRYPAAAILLDVEAAALPGGGHRLRRLEGALVFATGSNPEPVARRIQELLNLYTDRSHSVMEQRSVDELAVHRLSDERLPGWVFEWGVADEFFIVGVGAGSFGRIARVVRDSKASLAEDPWLRAARSACGASHPFLEIHVDAVRLRGQLGAMMEGTTRDVLAALRLDALQRGYWGVGLDGRFVEACSFLRMPDGDRLIPITVSRSARRPWERFVPAGASRAAVLAVSGSDLIRRGVRAYLASQSPSAQEAWARAWDRVVAGGDWSAESDFLELFGEVVILHDHPPHPLGIPLFCTVLVETDGPTQTVGRAVDRILGAVQRASAPAPDAAPPSPWAPVLRRDPDGVWYVQVGLLGPALAVTDGWIVISYAPHAVRANLGARATPASRPWGTDRTPGDGT